MVPLLPRLVAPPSAHVQAPALSRLVVSVDGYGVECEAEFDIEEPELGDLVSCPECGLDMEIITIKPLELEAVAEEEEEEEEPEEEDDWNE